MPDSELLRINAFLAAFARRQAARVVDLPGGFAVYDDAFAHSRANNQIVIDTAVDPDALPALADEALGELPHRLISVLDDEAGRACAKPMIRAGYVHSTCQVMLHTGPVPAAGPAEEVDLDAIRVPCCVTVDGSGWRCSRRAGCSEPPRPGCARRRSRRRTRPRRWPPVPGGSCRRTGWRSGCAVRRGAGTPGGSSGTHRVAEHRADPIPRWDEIVRHPEAPYDFRLRHAAHLPEPALRTGPLGRELTVARARHGLDGRRHESLDPVITDLLSTGQLTGADLVHEVAPAAVVLSFLDRARRRSDAPAEVRSAVSETAALVRDRLGEDTAAWHRVFARLAGQAPGHDPVVPVSALLSAT